MGHPRFVALLLLFTLLGLPGLPGAGALLEKKRCAEACGRKCCCRSSPGPGGCAMRGSSCCPVTPSSTVTAPSPKAAPVTRTHLPLPFGRPSRAPVGQAGLQLHDLPSPPDPPPRTAC